MCVFPGQNASTPSVRFLDTIGPAASGDELPILLSLCVNRTGSMSVSRSSRVNGASFPLREARQLEVRFAEINNSPDGRIGSKDKSRECLHSPLTRSLPTSSPPEVNGIKAKFILFGRTNEKRCLSSLIRTRSCWFYISVVRHFFDCTAFYPLTNDTRNCLDCLTSSKQLAK